MTKPSVQPNDPRLIEAARQVVQSRQENIEAWSEAVKGQGIERLLHEFVRLINGTLGQKEPAVAIAEMVADRFSNLFRLGHYASILEMGQEQLRVQDFMSFSDIRDLAYAEQQRRQTMGLNY